MKTHTFVICAYKESPYLEECIRSLKGQTIKSGIIMVTSTPNEYIQALAGKYHIPCFINTGESGITQDWNFGYKHADSKYITIAHQDDVYDRDYLAAALNALQKSENPLIFFSDYYEIRNGEKVTGTRLLKIKRFMLLPLRIRSLQKSRWLRRRILSFGSPICCPAVTYAAYNLPVPIFKNNYQACEDWEAWEMLSRLKGAFLYDSRRLMGHRIHAASETSMAIKNQKRSQEEYEMYLRFWPGGIAYLLGKLYSGGQKSNRL